MSKTMLIDAAHPEETRVAIVDGRQIEEFDFESEDEPGDLELWALEVLGSQEKKHG